MLKVVDLHAGYENKKVIEHLSLEIQKGEVTSIIGPNGCGKSTLLNCLTRYLKPFQGEIFLEDENIYKKSMKEFSQRLAILSQHHNITGSITVEQLVSYGRLPHKKWYQRNNEQDYAIIYQAMKDTNVLKYKDAFLHSLSGGEQQRVWIAMALAQTPDILLLDEPTTYLDISHQIELMKLIHQINQEKDITIIMVLHDLNQAAEYSDQIVMMKQGKIFAHGKPEEVMTCQNLKEVYQIKCDIHCNQYNQKLIITPLDTYTS